MSKLTKKEIESIVEHKINNTLWSLFWVSSTTVYCIYSYHSFVESILKHYNYSIMGVIWSMAIALFSLFLWLSSIYGMYKLNEED